MRGLPTDSPQVRLSKTLSWILRHGAASQGIAIRADGYVKVADIVRILSLAPPLGHSCSCFVVQLTNPKVKGQGLDLEGLKGIVECDAKKRYDLRCEDENGEWWIRANQGHSMKARYLSLLRVSPRSLTLGYFRISPTSKRHR